MSGSDYEIVALSQVFDSLKHLNKAQVSRVVHWVKDRFGLEEGPVTYEILPAMPIERVDTIPDENVSRENNTGPAMEEQAPKEKSAGKKDIKDYESISDLFADANAGKVSAKVLLMAAYLQERLILKEISSREISSRLKRIFPSIKHTSGIIANILKKNPPLLISSGKEGNTKQARKKFHVTELGLDEARKYLKNY
jgi:hypothetical protein